MSADNSKLGKISDVPEKMVALMDAHRSVITRLSAEKGC
ncbi:hypothetical protein SAMN05519103_08942 [Rhizobiales bacterium GAS113]|nr:hypothetical protein SAMN05519103_08942 [Rhizobiales bacterium GAS113]